MAANKEIEHIVETMSLAEIALAYRKELYHGSTTVANMYEEAYHTKYRKSWEERNKRRGLVA